MYDRSAAVRTRTGNLGAVVAGLGGLLVLLAFAVIPAIVLPFPVGEVAGAEAAWLAADEPLFALLWLIPLGAAAVVVVAAAHLLAAVPARAGRPSVVALAAVLLLALVAAFVAVHHGRIGPDGVGPGFWVAVAGAAVALLGGAGGLRAAPSHRSVLLAAIALVTAAATVGVVIALPRAEPAPIMAAGSVPVPTASGSAQSSTESSAQQPPTSRAAPVSGREELDRIVAADRPDVAALVGSWVPQLSAKRLGLEADGIVYAYEDIARHHRSLVVTYPDALLLLSDEYSSFREGGFYVVVVPVVFATGEEALSWCASQRLGPDDCLAKRLQTTGGPEGTTLYQQ